jgi:hypothetical protein
MSNTTHHKKKSIQELKKFGFTLGIALIVLSIVLLFLGRTGSPRLLSFAGLILILLAYGAPKWLAPVERAWTKFGEVFGGVVTRIILVVFFFLVVTPVGIIARLSGKQFLELGFRSGHHKTYWEKRAVAEQNVSGLEKQF